MDDPVLLLRNLIYVIILMKPYQISYIPIIPTNVQFLNSDPVKPSTPDSLRRCCVQKAFSHTLKPKTLNP